MLAAMVEWLLMPRPEWELMLRDTVLRHEATVRFTDLPTTAASGKTLLFDLSARLAAEGLDLLVADLSAPNAEGVHAVKVLIPGLEVETIAYARLGERNVTRLLAMERDDLIRVGSRPPGWARVHLTGEAEQRLGGAAWLDRTALDAVPGQLFPLYREPGWHSAQVAMRRSR